MADGRGRAEWAQTSALLALIANVNRDPKRKALTPKDFNPYEADRGEVSTPMKDLSMLKMFVKK